MVSKAFPFFQVRGGKFIADVHIFSFFFCVTFLGSGIKIPFGSMIAIGSRFSKGNTFRLDNLSDALFLFNSSKIATPAKMGLISRRRRNV